MKYDFIIVGGGTSGCLLARTLADTKQKPQILLIECGDTNSDPSLRIPGKRFTTFLTPGLDKGYQSVPQAQLGGNSLACLRGNGLGGSSATNFMTYTRGSKDNFDEWARVTKDQFWSWEACSHRFRTFEGLQVPSKDHMAFFQSDPDYGLGTRGELKLSHAIHWDNDIKKVIEAANSYGHPLNLDYNAGNPIGTGVGPGTFMNGLRTTSASAFLKSPPDNLHVLTNVIVTKVIFVGKRAIGVRSHNEDYFATLEVVLCTGALDTPKLLLLSGIGFSEDLSRLGISLVHNLPGVGKNLQDHPNIMFSLETQPDFTDLWKLVGNNEAMKQAEDQWFSNRSGPFTSSACSAAIGFVKLRDIFKSDEFQRLDEVTKNYLQKPTIPSYEWITQCPNMDPTKPPDAPVLAGFVVLLNALSRGSVSIRSKDPLDAPVCDLGLLRHPYDQFVMIRAFKDFLKFLESPMMRERFTSMNSFGTELSSNLPDAAILSYLKSGLMSTSHMAGTAKMGDQGDNTAVVDSHGRILGLQSIRIADMSIVPILPSGHSQSTAYLIGQSIAERLITDYEL